MFLIALVFLVSLTHGLPSNEEEWQLDLVQILLRNGISVPDILYPNDPNHPDAWEEGMGQLTLMGQKQLYAFGKDLKKRYSNFLTSNPTELKVQSTYLDKCMSSALCLLASLYEPDKSWEFIPGLKWQPIPVSYEPPHKDKLLKSVTDFESMDLEITPDAYSHLEKYEKQMKHWTLYSGMPVKDYFQASTLYKILSTEMIKNHTIPQWVSTYWHDLENLNNFVYKMTFTEPAIIKMIGGPILVQMVKNASYKRDGKRLDIKIIIYSGQSYHLAGTLGALNNFNGKEPPFGATLLMEMFKRRSQDNATNFDYAVKLSYFNEMDPHLQLRKPMPLLLPGCEEMCPLTYLADFTKQWNRHSWRVMKSHAI